MKLRNSTCDKRLLGIFQNGSIQLLCIDLPWVPGLAPPMAHVQEAISLEFFNTPSVPPQVHWFNDFRFSMCLSGSSQLFRHLHKCYRVARAGLQPFHFALNLPSVTDWGLPSTWLIRCCFASDLCTKTLLWVASLQLNWTAAFFKLEPVTDASMNLVPRPMVMSYGWTTGFSPCFTGFFTRKKSGEFEGKSC